MLEALTAGIWWLHPGLAVALLGLAVVWRGLTGDRGGERGLVRRTTTALGRAEGWRLTLVGLTLTGLGLAWLWELRWLLFLSLGIGFVEIQEASMVIRAWKAGQRKTAARRASEPGHAFPAYASKRIE
jgi:hypothetical protein